jgi:hypothetical protein
VVQGLIFGGCEHPEGAVTALAVVEDLEVLEDGVGELKTGAPPFAVQELGLHAGSEGLHHAVVIRVTDEAHRERQARCFDALAEGPRSALAAVVAMHHGRSGRLCGDGAPVRCSRPSGLPTGTHSVRGVREASSSPIRNIFRMLGRLQRAISEQVA